MSYNIRSIRDDRKALVRVIRGCRPDVLCVQEAPRLLRWRPRRRLLARRSGLLIAAGRKIAGLAVYVAPRFRVIHTAYHLLSRIPGLHQRGLAVAVLETGGSRLITASTHLDLAAGPRRTHAAEVMAHLERARDRFDAPVVLGGDINEEPEGAAWRALAARMPDCHAIAPSGKSSTFSSGNPRRRIDGIFADPAIGVISCGVPDEPALLRDYPHASDHLPVLAELRL